MSSTKLQPLSPPGVDAPRHRYSSPFGELGPGKKPLAEKTDRMQELEKMLVEVQDKAAEEEQKAYAKAYENGEKAGLSLGEKRAEQILETLQMLSDQAALQLRRLQNDSASLIIEIAEDIAKKIVGETLQSHPEIIRVIINEAMARLPSADMSSIAVHPDDFELFQKLLGDIKQDALLTCDRSISPGCCRIICREQDILISPNAAIEICMALLHTKLLEPLASNDTSPA